MRSSIACPPHRLAETLLIILWAATLSAVIAIPSLGSSPTLGDDLIRGTIRAALAFYLVALILMMVPRCDPSPSRRRARLCWTLAWLAYLIHLAMAFEHYHGWSHAHAIQHTEEVSGFGHGIYFSHLFTLLWTADVLYWWLRPAAHRTRPAWVSWCLHGFMLFIVFNATVVYESGPIRWAGIAGFALLAAFGCGIHSRWIRFRQAPHD